MISRTEEMVIHNPHQNDPIPRVLVVCSVGALRSPTVARVIHEQQINWNVRSAGLDPLALISVSERLIHWADMCITMETYQADIISGDWEFNGDIFNFSIPDIFMYYERELINIVTQRLETFQQWRY